MFFYLSTVQVFFEIIQLQIFVIPRIRCIKLDYEAKTVFCIQLAVYFFTVLPFMILDLVARYSINTQATITLQIGDLSFSLLLDCLLLSEDEQTTIGVWLEVDGFTRLSFFVLLLIFAVLIGKNTNEIAKQFQNGFSIFALIFFLFQIAWIGYGLYLVKNIVEPSDDLFELLGVDLCNDTIITILNVLGIGGIIVTLINMVVSSFRPNIEKREEEVVQAGTAQNILK